MKKISIEHIAFSVRDVSEMLGVSPAEVRRLVESGSLFSLKFGKKKSRLRIPKEAIADFIEQEMKSWKQGKLFD